MVDARHSLLLRKARASLAAQHLSHARQLCVEALASRRDDPEATTLLAQVAWAEAEHDEAIDLLKRHVKRHPRDAAARFGLAGYLNEQGRHREAIAEYERLLRLKPDPRLHAAAIAAIADALERQGDLDRARDWIERHGGSDGGATPALALVQARLLLAEKRYDECADLARSHAEHADNFHRSHLHYVMGQALERSGRYEAAFEAYRIANEVRAVPFDSEADAADISRTIEAFSRERLAQLPRATVDGSRAVFIVGRPRCGSTLVERIVGAHPDVHTAGETPALVKVAMGMSFTLASALAYPECVEDLDEESATRLGAQYLDHIGKHAPRARAFRGRITDKHLYTWRHLGLVEILLPGARIIDLRRERVDNCLACYTAPLGERYPFSTDLRHLGLAHVQYERLMRHWHDVLSAPMLRVNYEDLVADPETWSRRIVEFCGLPWNDRCLSFHEQKSGGGAARQAAPTLSYQQVRQPIYTSSVGRAQRFAPSLGPLLEALG